MSRRETFSNSIALRVIDEYDNSVVMQITTVLGHVYHVACRRVLLNGTFQILFNQVFRVGNFGNAKALRVIFFSKCSKLNLTFKNAAKDSEKVFYL